MSPKFPATANASSSFQAISYVAANFVVAVFIVVVVAVVVFFIVISNVCSRYSRISFSLKILAYLIKKVVLYCSDMYEHKRGNR